MLSIDDRTGSIELLPLFKPYDVTATSTRLEFGDACWLGKGPESEVLVGVERKTIGDLVQCMRDKRFAGYQLPGLLKVYDWVYLIVEGVTRAGRSGALETLWRRDWRPFSAGSKPILFREVDHFLATLQHIVGLTVWPTSNEEQTVTYIVSRYLWWQKPWIQHDSYREIYAPSDNLEVRRRGSFHIHQPTLAERVAVQFPGIGKAAFSVVKKFKTVEKMVGAGVEEWENVKVEVNGKGGKSLKKLGRSRAEVIWDALRRE